jgi:hypothetical protein
MYHTVSAHRGSRRSRGRWSPLNILLMVIGFALFWPLGLAMLAYIVWGDEIGRLTADLKGRFSGLSASNPLRGMTFGETGNVAFDEYRAREMKRLDEERRKLEGMKSEFDSFLKELRRVKDQEEFDRFLAEYRNRSDKADETGNS